MKRLLVLIIALLLLMITFPQPAFAEEETTAVTQTEGTTPPATGCGDSLAGDSGDGYKDRDSGSAGKRLR